MAVQILTYLDLSPEQRKKAAVTMRGQLQSACANPFLAVEQRQMLVSQMTRLTLWEHGKLPLLAARKS